MHLTAPLCTSTPPPPLHPSWWQFTSATNLHRDVLLALERWPNRLVAPTQSQQVDAVRRVKAQHLMSGSLPRGEMVCLGGGAVVPPEDTAVLPAKSPPASLLPLSVSDKMQSKTPPQQRKLRVEARLTPERATSLRLAAHVRASRGGPTSSRPSPLGDRDDSPATVMSIGVGGVPSPLAKARASGANSPPPVEVRGDSLDCVMATEVGDVSSPRATSTETLLCDLKFTPDRVAPKAAATPCTVAAPRAIAALRAIAAPGAGTAPRAIAALGPGAASRAIAAPGVGTAPRAGAASRAIAALRAGAASRAIAASRAATAPRADAAWDWGGGGAKRGAALLGGWSAKQHEQQEPKVSPKLPVRARPTRNPLSALSLTTAGAAPLHGGGQVCGAMARTPKRTRAPGDTGDAARPPRQLRQQPAFVDALHVPAFALDTPTQFSPIGQTLSSPQVVTSFLARPSPLARNFDSRKLVMKQRQQHIAHSAFMRRKQYLPESRLPMTSECTKAPESDMSSRAQIIEASYSSILDHLETMIEPEGAWDEATLEAMLADDPPSTQRAHGAPGAPLRPLAIARRRASGECRWACDDDRFA